jgi:hypothetical protein
LKSLERAIERSETGNECRIYSRTWAWRRASYQECLNLKKKGRECKFWQQKLGKNSSWWVVFIFSSLRILFCLFEIVKMGLENVRLMGASQTAVFSGEFHGNFWLIRCEQSCACLFFRAYFWNTATLACLISNMTGRFESLFSFPRPNSWRYFWFLCLPADVCCHGAGHRVFSSPWEKKFRYLGCYRQVSMILRFFSFLAFFFFCFISPLFVLLSSFGVHELDVEWTFFTPLVERRLGSILAAG